MNSSRLFEDGFDSKLLREAPSPYGLDIAELMQHSEQIRKCFSGEASSVFRELDRGAITYWQFTDLPANENMPPTPRDYTPQIEKKTYQSEAVIAAASLELGTLFGYKETSNHVMYDIYPVCGYEESSSFVSSKKRLAFHTDGSAHPLISPDYVMLYCIRNEPRAVNLIVSLSDILRRLSASTFAALKTASFSHLISQNPTRHHVKPILTEVEGELTVTYDEENVIGIDNESQQVLEDLNGLMYELAQEVPNRTDSLLIVNNKQALHSRTSFTPRFDGRDRWVKGAFVTKSGIAPGTIVGLSSKMVHLQPHVKYFLRRRSSTP